MCGFHGAGVVAARHGNEGRVGKERAEQTGTDLDEQRAEPHAFRGESIATAAADTLSQAMCAELAQVVAELTEGVVVFTEAVPSEDALSAMVTRQGRCRLAWRKVVSREMQTGRSLSSL